MRGRSVDAVEAAKQEAERERGRAAAAVERLIERRAGDVASPSWRPTKVVKAQAHYHNAKARQ